MMDPAQTIGAMLSAPEPWDAIDTIASGWTEAHAEAVAALLAAADTSGAHRHLLVSLLQFARQPSADAVLAARLPWAEGPEATSILGALNSRRVAVPSSEIKRRLDDPTPSVVAAAVVAAGISGDAALAPRLMERLDDWHAALSLAQLGRTDGADAILARLEAADGLNASGYIVALEQLGERSVVPRLRALLTRKRQVWDLHHALWRLTGREPLVPLSWKTEEVASAWASFEPLEPARPRVVPTRVQAKEVRFSVLDGEAALRIDYTPPGPGSSWPRWDLALYAGDTPVIGLGSHCGTCETTVQLSGASAEEARWVADQVRAVVADLPALSSATLTALEPYLTRLRTGHYCAFLVDLELERVQEAGRSWLVRRAERREEGDTSPPNWPGEEHFQVRGAPGHTYGIVLPLTPLVGLDAAVVGRWAETLRGGARPAAVAMAWLEQKHVHMETEEEVLLACVVDGHHKLAAYAQVGLPARVLLVCRLEDSAGPNPAAKLRAALQTLGQG